MINKIIYLILLSLHTVNFAFCESNFPELFKKRYGEVAQVLVFNHLSLVRDKLVQLNHDVLPHEVKTLRKEIGASRYYLDIFIYAYPCLGDLDLLRKLRKELDQGYTIFGNFKDLFDILGISKDEVSKSHYDSKELSYHRKLIFPWVKAYLLELECEVLVNYLKYPLVSLAQKREDFKLPRFIWRGLPSPDVEAGNFGTLTKKLLVSLSEKTQKRYYDVLEINDVFDHKSQETFHDFRKQLRYIVKTEKYFTDLLPERIIKGESFETLKKTVEKYGDLNDFITKQSYLLAKLSHSNSNHAMEHIVDLLKTKENIKSSWEALLDWQRANTVLFHLKNLVQEIKSL